MSDIDFAELDKAVNNLVNKNSTTTNAPMSEKVEEKTDHSVPMSQKPKGRFMDVLHPSSDMTGKENENTKAAKPVSQTPAQRKIVAPIYDSMVLPSKKDSSLAPSSSAPSNYEPAAKSDWPDPIEAVEATNKEDQTASSSDIKGKPAATTLFLPDTKVEKRPLGGFSGDNIPELTDENKKEETLSQKNADQSESVNADTAASDLPPELESDLVAIEEGHGDDSSQKFSEFENEKTLIDNDKLESEFIDEKSESEPAQAPDSQEDAIEPKYSKPSLEENHANYSEQQAHASKSELSGLLGAGSIPQQYKTVPAPHDSSDASHPMFFDADQYDKAPSPGTHGPHKTTLFQWIFIVVGLLLLGATLGAALFVFVSS